MAAATEALRRVDDPLLRPGVATRDVVGSGMASVTRTADGLRVALDVRTAAHPHARAIADACGRALERAGLSSETSVVLRADGFGARVGSSDGLASVRSCVAVASCKGGVGKSTVAANLAYALLAKGARVGLVDADVHGPSAPIQLGVEGARVLPAAAGGKFVAPVDARGLRVASMGFANAAPGGARGGGGALRGPLAGRVAAELLTTTDWGELDYLIVDLPPGVGDVALAVSAAVSVDAAVVVTTPSALARADVLRGLALQETLGVPTLAIVENLAVAVCRGCGARDRVFGDGHVAELADAAGLGADACFEVPVSAALAAANEAGAVGRAPPGPVFAALADRVVEFVYAAMHASKDRLLEVVFERRRNVLVLRSFDEDGASESYLSPADVRRDGGPPNPPDLAPTRVELVGNRSVVIDWSDNMKDDVYSVDDLLERAVAEAPPRPKIALTTSRGDPAKRAAAPV